MPSAKVELRAPRRDPSAHLLEGPQLPGRPRYGGVGMADVQLHHAAAAPVAGVGDAHAHLGDLTRTDRRRRHRGGRPPTIV